MVQLSRYRGTSTTIPFSTVGFSRQSGLCQEFRTTESVEEMTLRSTTLLTGPYSKLEQKDEQIRESRETMSL